MKVKKWGSMLVVFFSCCYYTSGVLGILLEWCYGGCVAVTCERRRWSLEEWWSHEMEAIGECVMPPTMFNAMQGWSTGTCHKVSPKHLYLISYLISHISQSLSLLFSVVRWFSLPSHFSLTLSTFTINACSATLPDHAHPPTVYSLFILKPPYLMHSSTSPHPIVSLFFFLLKISYLNTI